MSGIFDFDSNGLKHLIHKYGIHRTWISLLATHVNNSDAFKYILREPEFLGAIIFPGNLLQGLSIGEIGVLYEYSVTIHNSRSRKTNGQFFTPDDVAEFMAGYSKKFSKGIWLDPCSGIGNLSWHLVATQEEPEEFLVSSLILSDKDELALLIARTLLTLSFQKNHNNLFNDIKRNFTCFDFLSVADKSDLVLFDPVNLLSEIPNHDFVIVNPPYLSLKADKRFETAKAADLYAYFLENVIKTSKGFISITPQSFTNAKKFESLRQLILNKFKNLTVFTFDNVPANIFKGIKFGSKNTNTANSIRVAITIAIPGEGKQRITSLLRWRSSERPFLFTYLDNFLSDVSLTTDYFPKVSKQYENLYNEVVNRKTMSNLISSKKTEFPLYVPSSPRYFIVALKKRVKRASLKQLYFHSEQDRDYAYLLINSSFFYWWWRVRDGGMTLSLETLLSVPLIEFKLDKNLIQELEESESTNKVFKKNAGVKQYNVKHSQNLQFKLNNKLLPKYAKILTQLHENSELTRMII